ncbi:hypothetical protein A2372_01440 [Candidatus Wolfebacteria bacterium RIFOXYB1_FULL_54_12]|uniref:PDZ domain-containing protein n=1 Tax=Candidatus Wolfebacteria bacterium RIFOXYB1_FULL_54_12 TaxID=1802559 RepID=A0A1F8DX02_9BACT|nr:MAG: hypothetical protein A2372_01440 [Candidatus Wolfebacteria bacterium RIFOXYB1_FULL_54_12]
MKNMVKRVGLIAIVLVALVLVGGSAFYYGYKIGAETSEVTVLEGVSNLGEGKETRADFSLFWDTWNVLREKYVDSENVTDQDMVYGAISGMLASTGDPYSVFMPPKEADDFSQEISGEFGGIGAEIGVRNEQLVVIAPLKNTPADRAGLKAGDAILKIDDESTEDFSADNAVKKIRGKIGTNVTLTVFRGGWSATRDFNIVRDTIQIPTLDWKMLNDEGKEDPNGKILYIQLYNFYEKSPLLFYEALVESIDNDPKGIILDLRNNPGGYLDAAVNIAGWFIDRGSVVVTEKFRSEEDGHTSFEAQGMPIFKDMPTVVLINQGSASASEILAGALRDNNDSKLVGEKSFGKGSVQELIQLKDDAMVKITVAHWLTPKGTVIDKNGLTPDAEVKLTEEDINADKDPQLEKAVGVLKSEM